MEIMATKMIINIKMNINHLHSSHNRHIMKENNKSNNNSNIYNSKDNKFNICNRLIVSYIIINNKNHIKTSPSHNIIS